MIRGLLESLAEYPEAARDIGHWSLWRERQGGYDFGESIAAAVCTPGI